MSTSGYQYIIELFREDDSPLGQASVKVDWGPAEEWASSRRCAGGYFRLRGVAMIREAFEMEVSSIAKPQRLNRRDRSLFHSSQVAPAHRLEPRLTPPRAPSPLSRSLSERRVILVGTAR